MSSYLGLENIPAAIQSSPDVVTGDIEIEIVTLLYQLATHR